MSGLGRAHREALQALTLHQSGEERLLPGTTITRSAALELRAIVGLRPRAATEFDDYFRAVTTASQEPIIGGGDAFINEIVGSGNAAKAAALAWFAQHALEHGTAPVAGAWAASFPEWAVEVFLIAAVLDCAGSDTRRYPREAFRLVRGFVTLMRIDPAEQTVIALLGMDGSPIREHVWARFEEFVRKMSGATVMRAVRAVQEVRRRRLERPFTDGWGRPDDATYTWEARPPRRR